MSKPTPEQQHWYDLGYGMAFAEKNRWRILLNKCVGHFRGKADVPEALVGEVLTALQERRNGDV
jgi:hypothetical protein